MMPRVLVSVLLVILLFIGGCSGVTANAKYTELIHRTSVLMESAASRAERGEMPADEMKQSLRNSADSWKAIENAMEGKAQ